jgi:hypothetical protein
MINRRICRSTAAIAQGGNYQEQKEAACSAHGRATA